MKESTDARKFLEQMNGGPLTFGQMLASIRLGDELTLDSFAKKLGVSRQNVSDIEKGRRGVSVERAIQWAKVLGYSGKSFTELVLQDELRRAGVDWSVAVA